MIIHTTLRDFFSDVMPSNYDWRAFALLRCQRKSEKGHFVFHAVPAATIELPENDSEYENFQHYHKDDFDTVYEFEVDEVFYETEDEIVMDHFGPAFLFVSGKIAVYVGEGDGFQGIVRFTELFDPESPFESLDIDEKFVSEAPQYMRRAKTCKDVNRILKKTTLFLR